MYRLLIAPVAASIATAAAASDDRIVIVERAATTARVSYAGLDLQSTQGRRQMARRIRVAAERICVGTTVATGITGPVSSPCYVAAVNSGVSQMNALAGL